MSIEIIGAIGIIFVLFLMLLRMNIGIALAATGLIGYFILQQGPITMEMAGTVPYRTIASYGLTPVPLFVFMGAIIANTGLGEDLFRVGHIWFGQMKGGLAIATIAACALFAAICGSSTAETLAIGKFALPEMKKYKYADTLACGCIASGGTLAILIPPSLGFVLYGLMSEESIGTLFIAGIIPGIMLSLFFIFVSMCAFAVSDAILRR